MKSTAAAPSNIAFIKYWGKQDESLRLPANGSISMNLSNLTTTTTVEFSDMLKRDKVLINGQTDGKQIKRVTAHLDRIRSIAGIHTRARVISENNFPQGTGLSSSASGFAALTVAATCAAGLNLDTKCLSQIARLGSGSACRSVPDGFVEWIKSDTDDGSYAASLFDHTYWDICDVVAVVSTEAKSVPSSDGQKSARSSAFFQTRLLFMDNKLKQCRDAIRRRDFTRLGELSERDALEMHAVMITSDPPLLYWTNGTLDLMKRIRQWREESLEVYFTLNTGQDIHILSRPGDVPVLQKKLDGLDFVRKVIVNHPAKGAHQVGKHLF